MDLGPLRRRRLRERPDALAHLVLEDLGAAARHGLEPRLPEPLEHVRDVRPLLLREEVDLGRRERVPVHARISLAQEREELLVERERQLRVDAALQEDARAAERDRLLDLLPDLLEREDVALRVARGPVERAERAAVDADVRVVDVPVDLIRDAPGRMEPAPHRVRRASGLEERRLAEEGEAVVPRQAPAAARPLEDGAHARRAARPGDRRVRENGRVEDRGHSELPSRDERDADVRRRVRRGEQSVHVGAAVELREPLLVLGLEVVVQVAVDVRRADASTLSPVRGTAAATISSRCVFAYSRDQRNGSGGTDGRTAQTANTNGRPVSRRQPSARSSTWRPVRSALSAGSPRRSAASWWASISPRSGAAVWKSGAVPSRSLKRTRAIAAEERDERSRATVRASSSGRRLARMTLLTRSRRRDPDAPDDAHARDARGLDGRDESGVHLAAREPVRAGGRDVRDPVRALHRSPEKAPGQRPGVDVIDQGNAERGRHGPYQNTPRRQPRERFRRCRRGQVAMPDARAEA